MSLDLRTGRPVWLLNEKRITGHRKLAKDIRCEVAVVGGGVSGALIAHRLVNSGRQVIIVDTRDIGLGSTMASTAILSYEPDVHLIDLISQIGKRSAVRAYRAGLEALDSLEQTIKTLDDTCDFRRRESLYLASNRKDARMVRRECETRQKHDFKVELLTRRELAKSYSRFWCKYVWEAQQGPRRSKDYAASTAFQIAGTVWFLRRRLPRANCPL